MSQYQTLLREQTQFYEGSPNLNNNIIYPSPDRYRQNSNVNIIDINGT